MCYAILAISLDLIWGYTGLLCLCQALFFCLGGYAMGMYLAHHGGPEGNIGLHLWGKIPGCLFVVDSRVSLIPVPWFWKPFWTLPMTILLGVIIPGIVAGSHRFLRLSQPGSWRLFCHPDPGHRTGSANGFQYE